MKYFYNRYFPTPSYLAMNSFGIDISDQSIKYGELVPTAHGLRLGRFGIEKIPKGIVASGGVVQEDALIKILTTIRLKERFRFVRVSLSEEQIYIFTLTLPDSEGHNLREMILLQIEEYVPLPPRDVLFEYEIISREATFVAVRVFAIASHVIETYVSVFKRAGLVPLSFEPEARARARAVVPSHEGAPVLVVDYGESRTGISISAGSHVLFSSTLDIGSSSLTELLAKNFSLSFADAEALKCGYKIAESHADMTDIFPIILNGLSVVRDELQKHTLYWHTHTDGGVAHTPIHHVVLCGAGSNVSGFPEYLEATIGLRVVRANPWVNISNMEIDIPQMSLSESRGYATVLGLALGDYIVD